MIFFDELVEMRLYKRPVQLLINDEDKLRNNICFLLTPHYKESINIMNSPIILHKYYKSYYIEKDITYYVNHEGYIDYEDSYLYVTEDGPAVQQPNIQQPQVQQVNLQQVPKMGNTTSASVELPDAIKKIKYRSRSLKYKANKALHKIKKADREKESLGSTFSSDSSTTNYSMSDVKSTKSKEEEPVKEFMSYIKDDSYINNGYIRCNIDGNDIILANEDTINIMEANSMYDNKIQRMLYNNRFKTNTDVFAVHKEIKDNVSYISKTYIDLKQYKNLNMFVDLSFYNDTFFANNVWKHNKGLDFYSDYLERLLNYTIFKNAGYTNKMIIIPVNSWVKSDIAYDYTKDINPISMILRYLKVNPNKLQQTFKGCEILFLGEKGYFKCNLNNLDKKNLSKLHLFLDKLYSKEDILDGDDGVNSKISTKIIKTDIIDKIEKSQNITINNLTGDSKEITKDELVKKIDQAAASSNDTEEAIETLDDEDNKEEFIDLINKLSELDDPDTIKISSSRAARINKASEEFLKKKIANKSVKDIIKDNEDFTLPTTKLDIDSPNKEWTELKYMNFEKSYDVRSDILEILLSFSKLRYPLIVNDLSVENTSTSEDKIETWTIQWEDINGTRFTTRLDIPLFVDDKFMLLRGNQKTINAQLFRIPISKTEASVVQTVSNYNKIFCWVYGNNTSKSYIASNYIIRALDKYEGSKIKYSLSDNTKVCIRYYLPFDYVDLASVYGDINTPDYKIYFNQDKIRQDYKVDPNKGLPFAYNKKTKEVIYYNESTPISYIIYNMISSQDPEFMELCSSLKPSAKYSYSRVKMMSSEIPLVVVMCYTFGLIKTLKASNIKYELLEKRKKINPLHEDVIKFKDAYLYYELDYNSSMLMNGLKECSTEMYSITEVNKKPMYLDFLDQFGGRIKSDGLDNFADLMVDPITKEVCDFYKLPNTYIDLLSYANVLLSDTKYLDHTDMSGYRYRSNEIVAGYTYKALSESYADYATKMKKLGKATMVIKQTSVIDKILLDPTLSDLSKINDNLIVEAANTVSFKGLSGMNAERSYSLDKRVYDETMLNNLSMSTGFAGNVGLSRQTTIDMNINGKRGYMKESTIEDVGLKSLSVTEALNPFTSTKDDPFRQSMNFIQTAKHMMRPDKGMPSLISTGCDMALPYMTANTFTYKAAKDGVVKEVNDQYMLLEYKDGTRDVINLVERSEKNSDGGFYIALKLDTKYKKGQKFKANDILAYDKLSYSDIVGGDSEDIAYNLGVLTKAAIINTDENFEDSAIISSYLTEALATDIIIKDRRVLGKDTIIHFMIDKGAYVQEGDPILIFQNAFDDADTNMLIKQLNLDDNDTINELGRITIKSKVTGYIEDIQMFRTIEKEELSESLKKCFNKVNKYNNDMVKLCKTNKISYSDYEIDQTLPATGKLKDCRDSVCIEFHMKYHNQMGIGDKLVYLSANKGVVKDIFPKGKEPTSEFRPNEKIHTLSAMSSINGRMVCTIDNVGLINKGIIELDRKIKSMAGIPWKTLDEINNI